MSRGNCTGSRPKAEAEMPMQILCAPKKKMAHIALLCIRPVQFLQDMPATEIFVLGLMCGVVTVVAFSLRAIIITTLSSLPMHPRLLVPIKHQSHSSHKDGRAERRYERWK